MNPADPTSSKANPTPPNSPSPPVPDDSGRSATTGAPGGGSGGSKIWDEPNAAWDLLERGWEEFLQRERQRAQGPSPTPPPPHMIPSSSRGAVPPSPAPPPSSPSPPAGVHPGRIPASPLLTTPASPSAPTLPASINPPGVAPIRPAAADEVAKVRELGVKLEALLRRAFPEAKPTPGPQALTQLIQYALAQATQRDDQPGPIANPPVELAEALRIRNQALAALRAEAGTPPITTVEARRCVATFTQAIQGLTFYLKNPRVALPGGSSTWASYRAIPEASTASAPSTPSAPFSSPASAPSPPPSPNVVASPPPAVAAATQEDEDEMDVILDTAETEESNVGTVASPPVVAADAPSQSPAFASSPSSDPASTPVAPTAPTQTTANAALTDRHPTSAELPTSVPCDAPASQSAPPVKLLSTPVGETANRTPNNQRRADARRGTTTRSPHANPTRTTRPRGSRVKRLAVSLTLGAACGGAVWLGSVFWNAPFHEVDQLRRRAEVAMRQLEEFENDQEINDQLNRMIALRGEAAVAVQAGRLDDAALSYRSVIQDAQRLLDQRGVALRTELNAADSTALRLGDSANHPPAPIKPDDPVAVAWANSDDSESGPVGHNALQAQHDSQDTVDLDMPAAPPAPLDTPGEVPPPPTPLEVAMTPPRQNQTESTTIAPSPDPVGLVEPRPADDPPAPPDSPAPVIAARPTSQPSAPPAQEPTNLEPPPQRDASTATLAAAIPPPRRPSASDAASKSEEERPESEESPIEMPALPTTAEVANAEPRVEQEADQEAVSKSPDPAAVPDSEVASEARRRLEELVASAPAELRGEAGPLTRRLAELERRAAEESKEGAVALYDQAIASWNEWLDEATLEQATTLARAERHDEAMTLLSDLAQRKPDDPRVRLAVARSAGRAASWWLAHAEQTLKAFQEEADDPAGLVRPGGDGLGATAREHAWAWAEIARIKTRLHLPSQEALENARRAAEAVGDPLDRARAWGAVASAEVVAGLNDRARATLEAAAAQLEAVAPTLDQQGGCRAWWVAIELVRRAGELGEPRLWETCVRRSFAVRPSYTATRAHRPGLSTADYDRFWTGMYHLAYGDLASARALADALCDQDDSTFKGDPYLHAALARTSAAMGDLPGATRSIEKVQHLLTNPSSELPSVRRAECLGMIASAAALSGDYGLCQTLLKKVPEGPARDEALLTLAQVAAQAGRLDQAMAAAEMIRDPVDRAAAIRIQAAARAQRREFAPLIGWIAGLDSPIRQAEALAGAAAGVAPRLARSPVESGNRAAANPRSEPPR